MLVGLDFDNTIAVYDDVFREAAVRRGVLPAGFEGGKRAIRSVLRAREGGELQWRELQGYVYGHGMADAVPFAGVGGFLARCRAEGASVCVVSHKTPFNTYDPDRVDTRSAARAWMARHGFFDPAGSALVEDDVHFLSTRAEKVARIAALDCDVFVDDLEEVFAEPDFPPRTRKIWLTESGDDAPADDITPAASWPAVEALVFGAR